jgi:hypothetical protein
MQMKRNRNKNRLLAMMVAVMMSFGIIVTMPVTAYASGALVELYLVTPEHNIRPGAGVIIELRVTPDPRVDAMSVHVTFDSPYVENFARVPHEGDIPGGWVTLSNSSLPQPDFGPQIYYPNLGDVFGGWGTEFMNPGGMTIAGTYSRFVFTVSENAPIPDPEADPPVLPTILDFTLHVDVFVDDDFLSLPFNIAPDNGVLSLTVLGGGWVPSQRVWDIVADGYLFGDLADNRFAVPTSAAAATQNLLFLSQLNAPAAVNQRTQASTAAQFPNHRMLYLFNALEEALYNGDLEEPDVSDRFVTIVEDGYMFGDIADNRFVIPTPAAAATQNLLFLSQMNAPAAVNARTQASTAAQFPNHRMLYLFDTLRYLLNIT